MGVRRTLLQAARSSSAVRGAARFGLGSRALVYVTLTVLVVQLSVGDRRANTDQGSSIKALGETFFGRAALIALAVGVVCYATWRLVVAAISQARARDRWLALVEGLAYVPFGYMAVGVLVGDDAAATQGPRYRSLSARVMQEAAGRWLVGLVGLVVVVVGAFLASQGVRASFMPALRLPEGRPGLARTVRIVGAVGSIGRGVVFAFAGTLIVYAAVTGSPSKSGGVDAALDAVRALPMGRYLLLATAVALLAFAALTLVEAVWREVTPTSGSPRPAPGPRARPAPGGRRRDRTR